MSDVRSVCHGMSAEQHGNIVIVRRPPHRSHMNRIIFNHPICLCWCVCACVWLSVCVRVGVVCLPVARNKPFCCHFCWCEAVNDSKWTPRYFLHNPPDRCCDLFICFTIAMRWQRMHRSIQRHQIEMCFSMRFFGNGFALGFVSMLSPVNVDSSEINLLFTAQSDGWQIKLDILFNDSLFNGIKCKLIALRKSWNSFVSLSLGDCLTSKCWWLRRS